VGATRGIALAVVAVPLLACGGSDQPPGEIEGPARAAAAVRAGEVAQERARRALESQSAPPGTAPAKRVLFGDLHVHSTYSIDAFVYALPFFSGEGARPPADACDFARHCAAVDFFSINDHAEGLTPARWQATKASIRQCNALAGDPADPDLVAFTGWEWTQVGATPRDHYGHKNVIFRDLADDELPARPISSLPDDILKRAPPAGVLRAAQWLAPGAYADFLWWVERLAQLENCQQGVDTRALPVDCRENATTPAALFAKLDQWGFEALVIPHGLAWGVHAPPGASIENQLTRAQHAPARQRLIEIWSGHGNGEEYRSWRDLVRAADGSAICTEPTADYLPCCWRAGQIMRARCGDLPEAVCETRVEEAKRLALEAGVDPHLVFPDTRPEDWLDCDQCRDCFKPAYAHRPRETAQYSLAIGGFGDAGAGADPLRFRWGFIASTDNHTSRPGTGYKQYDRLWMTDSRGPATSLRDRVLRPIIAGRVGDRQRPKPAQRSVRSFSSLLDTERTASFMYPGGLVAVHATGRDRASIWDALVRREVYGTSGPRILLWFDLLNGPEGLAPMGSEVTLATAPRFEVRAVGSLAQKPGCPDESTRALSPERLASLCRGECYHPSDRRHAISAIEVVRIRPQTVPGQDVDALIEDPWRRFRCEPDPRGCVVRFEDPEGSASGRGAVYYARALQEPTPAINAANLRTEFDADGNPLCTTPCYGDYRTPFDDDCLAMVEERAWSSPIYLDPAGAGVE
jgi:hypothetical protein